MGGDHDLYFIFLRVFLVERCLLLVVASEYCQEVDT